MIPLCRPRKAFDVLSRFEEEHFREVVTDERCFLVRQTSRNATIELTDYRAPLETHLDATEPEYHHMLVISASNIALVMDGLEIVPAAGDVVIFDTSRPHALEVYEKGPVQLRTFDHISGEPLNPYAFLFMIERDLARAALCP